MPYKQAYLGDQHDEEQPAPLQAPPPMPDNDIANAANMVIAANVAEPQALERVRGGQADVLADIVQRPERAPRPPLAPTDGLPEMQVDEPRQAPRPLPARPANGARGLAANVPIEIDDEDLRAGPAVPRLPAQELQPALEGRRWPRRRLPRGPNRAPAPAGREDGDSDSNSDVFVDVDALALAQRPPANEPAQGTAVVGNVQAEPAPPLAQAPAEPGRVARRGRNDAGLLALGVRAMEYDPPPPRHMLNRRPRAAGAGRDLQPIGADPPGPRPVIEPEQAQPYVYRPIRVRSPRPAVDPNADPEPYAGQLRLQRQREEELLADEAMAAAIERRRGNAEGAAAMHQDRVRRERNGERLDREREQDEMRVRRLAQQRAQEDAQAEMRGQPRAWAEAAMRRAGFPLGLRPDVGNFELRPPPGGVGPLGHHFLWDRIDAGAGGGYGLAQFFGGIIPPMRPEVNIKAAWDAIKLQIRPQSQARPGFTFSFDMEAVEAEKAVIGIDVEAEPAAPEASTHLVCARCHRLLRFSAGEGPPEDRLHSLKCGHVIDQRCLDAISTPPPDPIRSDDAEIIGLMTSTPIPIAAPVHATHDEFRGTAGPSRATTRSQARKLSAEIDSPATNTSQKRKRVATASSAAAALPKSKKSRSRKPLEFTWLCPVKGCDTQHISKEIGGVWVVQDNQTVLLYVT